MELGLNGKIVLITGSARGIGKTVAKAFAKEGAILVLNDILEDVLKATVKEFNEEGFKTYGYAFDITDEDADYIVKSVKEVVEYLRGFSPVWRDLVAGKTAFIL